jgi:hypothetical protein
LDGCSTLGCLKRIVARGLCRTCYARWYRSTPRGKAIEKKENRKYRNTEGGKLAKRRGQRKWHQTERGQAYHKYYTALPRAQESHRASGRRSYRNNIAACKARSVERKRHIRRATPAWADLTRVRAVYLKCPPGHHVDHIVPLRGKNVCGLHVENNLQYLPAAENIRKRNHF